MKNRKKKYFIAGQEGMVGTAIYNLLKKKVEREKKKKFLNNPIRTNRKINK